MAQLQIVYLLRSGTQERWRRLGQEIAGSQNEQFEDGKARAAPTWLGESAAACEHRYA